MVYYGMMENYGFGWMALIWILCWLIGAFVFSVIFWLTYNWLAKKR